MKVKTISATYERKFNLGDFNSMTVSVSAWADTFEGENVSEAYDNLFELLKEEVKTQAMPVLKPISTKVDQKFMGKTILPATTQQE